MRYRALALVSATMLLATAAQAGEAPYWGTTGRNAQHTGVADVQSQPLGGVRWQTRVDRRPQYTRRGFLLAHYGSPMITAGNTVLIPVKTATAGKFRLQAHRGSDGRRLWSKRSDYALPPHRWLPTFSPVITPVGKLWMPAAGGTLVSRTILDEPGGGDTQRVAYYGLHNYDSDKRTYRDSVFINTPLTSDDQGNIFFGVETVGAPPSDLENVLVRMTDAGEALTVTPAGMTNDPTMTQIVANSAPALSNDGARLYVAVTDGNAGYLVALNSATLETLAHVRLVDPSSGLDALLNEDGTAAPMVGPDGDVYFGVLEQLFGWNHGRGWLMHYDADLIAKGFVGAFGWDDTPSVVPTSMVPGYSGTSPYLVMTKYNDYVQAGGTGVNRLAVLDPNASMRDPVSGLDVMQEVMTVAGVTPDEDYVGMYPGAVREWCVNTAAVDPVSRTILANNEDGRLYRWDMVTGELLESIQITAGLGQAYTPTMIGPDGIVYAINNATLFAVGFSKH